MSRGEQRTKATQIRFINFHESVPIFFFSSVCGLLLLYVFYSFQLIRIFITVYTLNVAQLCIMRMYDVCVCTCFGYDDIVDGVDSAAILYYKHMNEMPVVWHG